MQEQRNTLQNEILQLIESKLPTTYDGPDINTLQKQESELTESIETLLTNIDSSNAGVQLIKTTIKQTKANIRNNYNETELQHHVSTLQTLETELNELRDEIKTQQGIIDAKQEKIDHLGTHQYDPECKYCTSNIFVQNAIEAQNTIEADRDVLNTTKEQIIALNQEIETLSPVFEQTKQLNALQNSIKTNKITLERNELQLQILESDLQTRESELETVIERHQSFLHNETAIKHNQTIDTQIDTCKQQKAAIS